MKHCFRSNRRILSTVSALLLCTMIPLSTCLAEEIAPSIGLHSKAMLFSFSGLSVLGAGAFEGGFGGKYYLMENIAIRGSLQFLTASASTPGTITDGDTSATRFGLSAAAEYHLLKTRVSPYVGGGLSFSTTSTSDKNAVNTAGGTQTTTKNKIGGESIGGKTYLGGTGFGINGLAGVEFFIAKEVSLSAEYQLGYSLLSEADQVAGTVTTKAGSINTFGITATGLLTLAFYF